MKNLIYYIITSCIILFGYSCVEDTGNYDYEDVASISPVEVSELNERYDVVSLDYLDIDFHVGGNESENDYLWYVYYPSGSPSGVTTIGNERHLNYQVVLPVGTYQLVLEVKKRETGVAAYRKALLNITTHFSYGWYVSKELNGKTDIDFYNLADNTFHPDILQTINGDAPAGHSLGSCYATNSGNLLTGYSYEVENDNGTVTLMKDKSAVFVTTDEDIRIYKAEDLTQLKTFNSAFLETPSRQAPQKIWTSLLGQCLINDGKFHNIRSSMYNVGKFGYPLGTENYSFSPYVISHSGGYLLFDRNSGTFKKMNIWYDTPTDLKNISGMPTNCELIYMQEKAYTSMFGTGVNSTFALVKNKNTGDYSILSLNIPYHFFYNSSLLTATTAVPSTSGLTEASLFTLNNGENYPFMYYSKGDNKIGAYNLTTGMETAGFISFPEGETVSYIRHLYVENMNNGAIFTQKFVVLTNKNNRWKLYSFDFQTGSDGWKVVPEPSAIIEGDGNAKHVFYRDVNVVLAN